MQRGGKRSAKSADITTTGIDGRMTLRATDFGLTSRTVLQYAQMQRSVVLVCCNYSSVQDFTWEVLQVGSTTLKKNLLILSDLPPSEKQNLETHAHEGVHGREMRKMFVLGEYEVGAPVRFRDELLLETKLTASYVTFVFRRKETSMRIISPKCMAF